MGRFSYESTTAESFPIDDRTLAHLELAIAAKLRRGESFVFTLAGSELPAGQGRRDFWMHPAIPVQFGYDDDRRTVQLNPTWIGELVASAFTEQGMRIVPEPAPAPQPDELLG